MTLHDGVKILRQTVEHAITINTTSRKTSMIRSQGVIKVLHEIIKTSFIT